MNQAQGPSSQGFLVPQARTPAPPPSQVSPHPYTHWNTGDHGRGGPWWGWWIRAFLGCTSLTCWMGQWSQRKRCHTVSSLGCAPGINSQKSSWAPTHVRSRCNIIHLWRKLWQNAEPGLCKAVFLQEQALCFNEFKHPSHLCWRKWGLVCSRTSHTEAQQWGGMDVDNRQDPWGTSPISPATQWSAKATASSPSVKQEWR